jgi:hypothetical protein
MEDAIAGAAALAGVENYETKDSLKRRAFSRRSSAA